MLPFMWKGMGASEVISRSPKTDWSAIETLDLIVKTGIGSLSGFRSGFSDGTCGYAVAFRYRMRSFFFSYSTIAKFRLDTFSNSEVETLEISTSLARYSFVGAWTRGVQGFIVASENMANDITQRLQARDVAAVCGMARHCVIGSC